jgi:FKBP-type peptidyl-prolyl cis-trans isomerase
MRLVGSTAALWCLIAATVFAQNGPKSAPGPDANNAATVGGYGIGLDIGRHLKADGMDISIESLAQGIRDGLQGTPPKYTEDQLRAAFAVFQRQALARQPQANSSEADKNLREGQAFLAATKARPEIVTLPSGLQYRVLQSGNGPSPKATDTVKVHYEGSLLNGKVFDSSIKRNEPAKFPVNGVIPGWTEALQRMKVGDHWQLIVPSDLAYGPRGMPPAGIGPNSVLIFDVRLLGIEPPQ